MKEIVFIKEKSFVAKCASKIMKSKYVALVIGRTIFLHNITKNELLQNKSLLTHELVHIKQYKKLGLIRFLFFYIIEAIKNGYWNNKFEIEARSFEKEHEIIEEYLLIKEA